jgi:hypothetical protein
LSCGPKRLPLSRILIGFVALSVLALEVHPSRRWLVAIGDPGLAGYPKNQF